MHGNSLSIRCISALCICSLSIAKINRFLDLQRRTQKRILEFKELKIIIIAENGRNITENKKLACHLVEENYQIEFVNLSKKL